MQFQYVHEQFQYIASQMPEKIAIEWGGRKISYGALDEAVNQIAHFLHRQIGEPTQIAVVLENGIELVEAMLGVMKSGNIFAPLDPEFPENRIRMMLHEIQAEWVITRAGWLEKLERMMEGENRRIHAFVLDLDTETRAYENIDIYPFDPALSRAFDAAEAVTNRHCYIYFTSGSTGKPKAILGRSKSLSHFIDWELGECEVKADWVVSQLISPSFDPFLRDVLVPLCAGATLAIPERRDLILYPERLAAWIDEQKVTLIHMVPTVFKALMTEVHDGGMFAGLRYILLAGEMLRGNDVRKFFELFGERIQLINLYGPTETTLVKAFHRIRPEDAERVSVPIGKAIPGAQLMILDEEMQNCVKGTVGEIYIRTPYITSGYLNDKELTRKVFLQNPFTDNPQDIIYKTGDLGRIMESGEMEILGRADHQVKIRGVRIELGEIENQLLRLPHVREAVAAAKEDQNGNPILCAYVVTEEADPGELKEMLAKELPDSMLPAYWMRLDAMPLTPNGKIDRKALPEPELGAGVEYVAPGTPAEETLLRIWSEVLGVDGIGIRHNFFDLGGHSLKAAAIVSRIHKEMNVDIPLKDIFVFPTVRELAACIEEADESIYASIKPAEEKEHYPVSSSQRRVYVLHQLEQTAITYNLPRVLNVIGKLDLERMETSIKALIRRHATLRTHFRSVMGEIVQKIKPEVDFTLTCTDAAESEVPERVRAFLQPFNLERPPLLRVELLRLEPEKYVLLFDTHHIISDGTSMDILVRDFVALYEGKELPELPIQYKDFAVWQNELFAGGAMAEQEAYWLRTFAGSLPVLNLPTDFPRPALQSFEGSRMHFALDEALTKGLNELARRNGTTLYMVLLAAYNVLLAKYSGQDDVVVGSPIAGRSHMDLQQIIGVFINTLAMRNYPESGKRFRDFLQEVKGNALKAYENQDYPFEELVTKLNVPRDLSRNPVFDTMFILHNNEHATLSIEGLQFVPYPFESRMSKFDLTLSAEEWQNQVAMTFEYCTRLFKAETMERMSKHYVNILRQVAANANIGLADIEMIHPEERTKILRTFNNTCVEYGTEKTVQQLFEEQAARTPEHPALAFGEHQLTYAQVNAGANQLAWMLREKGVKPDTVVGIMLERSFPMLVGLLGILKSGAAYLPIDPDYPTDRIQYVLEDSQTKLVLTQGKYMETLQAMGVEAIQINDMSAYQGDAGNPEPLNHPENLAYIIYTSGSTGKPKGVMVEHRAVFNFIRGIADQIEFTPEKSILALTTISFDIFGLETLLPLAMGTKVVIGDEEEQKDTKAIARAVERNGINMLQMTPSRMRMLLNDEESAACLAQISELMIGGESLPEVLIKEIRAITKAKIYNMYGPTETTIWSAVKDLTEAEHVTIGRPIANTAMYIVGAADRLQPIGVPGELCISGSGLARGYWNRPELTAEKFAANPFAGEHTIPSQGERMYRTGDLARWLPNGEIECLGRIDDQVKVRGYRIEPGEIESQLMKHEGVREVVVVAKDEPAGGKYLCAYLVGEGELYVPDLKAHLSKVLPDYMIPTYFIQIPELPYTPNGKIDRRALPEPSAANISSVEYVAPVNEIEEKIITIWQEVLGIEGIGTAHNFFDIGGNSINIIKVIGLISKRMGVQVSIGELFMWPTAAEIANNMFVESPLKGLECMIQLNKPTPDKPNVFILHTWEGIVYQYKEIAKRLEGEYNVYGIQARGIMRPAKLPDSTEEMILEYIAEIKAVQPEGPYLLAGYCYGNWILYKMVEMLEDQNVPIDRMIQIDENAYMNDQTRKRCDFDKKYLRPLRKIRTWMRKHITRRRKNPMDYFPTVEEFRKMYPPVHGDVKNERTIRQHVNWLCTAGYRVKRYIETDTYVIKAEENNLVRYTQEDWQQMVYGKVWFVEIPGGHESIFAYPYVDGLTEAFKRSLEE